MKKTNGALLTSVLALALCFVMLLGTTWAWFTDEVTSAGNIIQAGTLKIDLEHLTDPANDTWTSIKDNPDHKVFNYSLWEPGYTQYETLRITNEDSTLALKFRLNAVATTGSAVLGKGGENLADVIDVYVKPGIIEKPANFAAILDDSTWRKAGTLTELMQDPDGVAYGIIVPNRDHDYNLTDAEKAITVEKKVEMTFALHMREEAGNEYQGLSVGDIALNLFATQYTYEDDSFDDLYDDGLELIKDGVLTEENGIQYIDSGDDVYLYLVTEDFAGDTVDVPANVTKIGNYAFAYNPNVKTVNVPGTVKDLGRGFDSSNVETVILGEGIETVSSRAFRKTANLKTVVLPSTLKTIADNAFAQCGVEELVIPASVEHVEFAGLAYMPNLKKITFEGSPKLENYVCRACPKLEDVYLLGENTTFGTGSIFFSTTEGGINNTITMHFYNQALADSFAAVSAEKNYTVDILNP